MCCGLALSPDLLEPLHPRLLSYCLCSGGLRGLSYETAIQGVLWFSLLLLPFLQYPKHPNKHSSCKQT
jgi:hypothetical protein